MKLKCTLNGGVAEVGDKAAAELIASGHWKPVEAEVSEPAPRKRTVRAKVAPADTEE